jgi:hypothetical protein
MLKWICAGALAVGLASPAFAQKTDLPDRPAKQIKDFDQTAMKEGIATLKASGECTVQYIVGVNGKAKDITTDCSMPEMGPYVTRSIETGEWEPEIFDHEFFDSFPVKQVFKFAAAPGAPAVDPRGEKSPVLVSGIEQKDIARAINQVDKPGTCNVKYTVGADGKPKDIVPNCDPVAYDEKIIEAMKKMKFEPGQKDGKPTDWPGLNTPMNLTKPNG